MYSSQTVESKGNLQAYVSYMEGKQNLQKTGTHQQALRPLIELLCYLGDVLIQALSLEKWRFLKVQVDQTQQHGSSKFCVLSHFTESAIEDQSFGLTE